MAASNIFLVGLMGAGKTTVGRALAKRLGKRFVDTDQEIEARTGATVSLIFEIEGEDSFRQREADVIRELTAQSDIVLATGGGAILRAGNRELLSARGTVIYLRASVNQLLQRTGRDRSRPLLQTADPRKKIEQLSREREPFYRDVAHLTIDTGRPNVQFLVNSILAQLDFHQCNAPEAPAPDAATETITPPDGSGHHAHSSPAMQTAIPPDSARLDNSVVLTVDLGERSYPITIGKSLLDDGEALTRGIAGKRVAVVTNTVVGPLYLDRVMATLDAAGKQAIAIVLPDGEEEKNWASLMRVFDTLLAEKCDRGTTLVALGGGVIGDLTGYAAASYMRGVPFVQIPTTLLAQVDSSVGGKTGINHPLGKNMIGAFYQPRAVVADTATLDTLPARELSAGLAEVIKYGAVLDAAFFDWIEANIARLVACDGDALAYAIRRSCEIKADVVRQDERESGLRAVLNFGHTFGHAIEAGLGYGEWLHGEAVGCGMVMAADLSLRMGFINAGTRARIVALVQAAGLPVKAPDLGREQWTALMQVDKKNEGGRIKFILMKPLGGAIVTAVPADLLAETLDACVA